MVDGRLVDWRGSERKTAVVYMYSGSLMLLLFLFWLPENARCEDARMRRREDAGCAVCKGKASVGGRYVCNSTVVVQSVNVRARYEGGCRLRKGPQQGDPNGRDTHSLSHTHSLARAGGS